MTFDSKTFFCGINMQINLVNVSNHIFSNLSSDKICYKRLLQDLITHRYIIDSTLDFISSLGFPENNSLYDITCSTIIQYSCAEIIKIKFNHIDITYTESAFQKAEIIYILSIIKQIKEIICNINTIIVECILSDNTNIKISENKLINNDLDFVTTFYNASTSISIDDAENLNCNVLFINYYELLLLKDSKYTQKEAIEILLKSKTKTKYIIDSIINNDTVIKSIKKFNKTILLLETHVNKLYN